MGDLEKWANNGKYIRLGDGQFNGKYIGFEKGNFRGTPTINYKFEVDGESKILSSGSKRLARLMDKVNPGDNVFINKFGEGFDTNYEVKVESWD